MSDWWNDLEPWADGDSVGPVKGDGTGEYSVSGINKADHNILGDFRNNDFDVNDPSYSRGLMLVGGLFLLAGLLACVLLRFMIKWTAGRRKTSLSERLLDTSEYSDGTTRGKGLLALALAAAAALAWVVKSLFEVEVRMNKIEGATDEIVDDLLRAFSLPGRASTALLGVLSAYLRAQVGFDSCFYVDHDADEPVQKLEDGVKLNMHILEGSGLNELADGVDGVSFKILQMRDARHRAVWPTMAACVLLLAVYLLLGARECRGKAAKDETVVTAAAAAVAAAVGGDEDEDVDDGIDGGIESSGRGKRNKRLWSCCCGDERSRCLRFFTFVLAFLVWMTAAGSVTLSALSGDFCSNLDESVENVLADGQDSALLTPLVEYYTGDCSEMLANLAVMSINAAQNVAKTTMEAAMGIMTAEAKFCRNAFHDVELMGKSMKGLWASLDDAARVASCSHINGLYRSAVWDELCAELPGWLLSLLVSCAMLSALLLLLWVQWTFMLRKRREDEGLELGSIPFAFGDKPLRKTAAAAGTAAFVSEYGTASYASDLGAGEGRYHPVRVSSSSDSASTMGGRGEFDFGVLPDSFPPSRSR